MASTPLKTPLIQGSMMSEVVKNSQRFFDTCHENGITLNMCKVQWEREKRFCSEASSLTQLSQALSSSQQSRFRVFDSNVPDWWQFIFGSRSDRGRSGTDQATSEKGSHVPVAPGAQDRLGSPKTLAYLCPRCLILLIVDASGLNGLGFVKQQKQDNNTWQEVQAGLRS
jgi:hypothetical protein